jgi:hypothetical protein
MEPDSALVELKVSTELPCPAVNEAGLAVSVAVGAGDELPLLGELHPDRMMVREKITARNFMAGRFMVPGRGRN